MQPTPPPTQTYELPVFPPGETITKHVHQVFFGARGISDELKANIEKIKALNPGWEHTLYDDVMMKDFIVQHYGPKMLGYFNRINPSYGAARVDLFRYLLLYKLGGVYLDVKSSLHRPFHEILREDDRYILGQWDNPALVERTGWGMHKELVDVPRGEFQQWHIMCAPGHPFMRAVIVAVLANIDAYLPWRAGTGGPGTFRVTGPVAYTLAIHPLRDRYPHRMIDTVEAGLEYTIFKQRTHSKIFIKHYYSLTEPIVALSPPMAAVWFARRAARKVKGGLRRAVRLVKPSPPSAAS